VKLTSDRFSFHLTDLACFFIFIADSFSIKIWFSNSKYHGKSIGKSPLKHRFKFIFKEILKIGLVINFIITIPYISIECEKLLSSLHWFSSYSTYNNTPPWMLHFSEKCLVENKVMIYLKKIWYCCHYSYFVFVFVFQSLASSNKNETNNLKFRFFKSRDHGHPCPIIT